VRSLVFEDDKKYPAGSKQFHLADHQNGRPAARRGFNYLKDFTGRRFSGHPLYVGWG
jgi:hypothetical protein